MLGVTMKPPLKSCALWVVLVLTVVTTAARAETSLKVYASRHYHIHTNLTKAETVPFGRHMDAIYDQYAKRFADYASTAQAGKLMPLYLFRTQQQYNDFLAQHGIKAEGSGGMFFVTHRLEGLATWAGDTRRSRTFATLQHEGFHQFAWYHLGPNLPVWMNEGLAQYFEDAVIIDRGMELGLADPHRIEMVREALMTRNAVAIDELLRLNSTQWSSALRADASRSGLLYAQSWSLVYFMIHGEDGQYRRPFETYLRLLSEGSTHDRAFRFAFNVNDVKALEAQWRRFALAQQAEQVNVAASRLEFLASAMAYKTQRDETIPATFDLFRSDLRQRGFALRLTGHGQDREMRADDTSLFTFTRPGGEVCDFVMLEPEGFGLPPRLTAPGLDPEPTLAWERDAVGQLVYDIRYR